MGMKTRHMSELANEPTNDEKLFSLLSHISFFFGALVLPLVFWIINKDKSKFVAFNSLQALFFQLATTVIIIVTITAIAVITILSGAMNDGTPHTWVMLILLFLYGVFMIAIFWSGIYSVYMGVKSYRGEMKEYPIIGKIVYKKVFGTSYSNVPQ